MTPRELLRIITRHCGDPIRVTGSHHIFTSPHTGMPVLVARHGRELPGPWIRKTLVGALGLSEEDALKEVSG